MNKQLGATTTEPVIISGRIMIPADTVGSGSYMDVLVRGEGINLTTIANFKDDSSIMVGNSRVANAKFAADKWLSYVLVVKPGSGKYSVTGYFFGEGIMDADGGPVEDGYIVVTQDSASNSLDGYVKARLPHFGARHGCYGRFKRSICRRYPYLQPRFVQAFDG